VRTSAHAHGLPVVDCLREYLRAKTALCLNWGPYEAPKKCKLQNKAIILQLNTLGECFLKVAESVVNRNADERAIALT
jgi:hypothetical protein